MRTRLVAASVFAAWLAFADTGVSPRPAPKNYQAHRDYIAASILSADAAAKIFSPEVAKKYVVIEVAVFPKTGETIDIHTLDFALQTGPEARSFPATPEEVSSIWREKKPSAPGAVNVVTEAGVGYGHRTNPATGKSESGWGAYTGVGVDNRPQPSPRPSAGPDPYALQTKLQKFALPEVQTGKPIAGYLYFPALKKSKAPLQLEYSGNGSRIDLVF